MPAATPAQARSAFALRQQGLALDAIAAALGLPESTVQSAIRRRAILVTKEHAEQLRATELARIDAVWTPIKKDYDALTDLAVSGVVLTEAQEDRRERLLGQLMRISKWRLDWAPMPAAIPAGGVGGGITVVIRNVLPPPGPKQVEGETVVTLPAVAAAVAEEVDEPDPDPAS
jgi:hypothetical protein